MANSSKFNSLIDIIVQSIQDVKGNNISLLDLREIDNRVSDYFVIVMDQTYRLMQFLACDQKG